MVSGDAFGYSDLIKEKGPEYLGDIIADGKGAECLMIESPDKVIELFERQIIAERVADDYTNVIAIALRRYPFLKSLK